MTTKQKTKTTVEKMSALRQAITASRPSVGKNSIAAIAAVATAVENGEPVTVAKRLPTDKRVYEPGDELVVPTDWANRDKLVNNGFFITAERHAKLARHNELKRFYSQDVEPLERTVNRLRTEFTKAAVAVGEAEATLDVANSEAENAQNKLAQQLEKLDAILDYSPVE